MRTQECRPFNLLTPENARTTLFRAARGAPHWDVCAHVCGDDSACCYIARARARPHATRARARGEQPGRATFRVLAHGDSDDDDDDDDDA